VYFVLQSFMRDLAMTEIGRGISVAIWKENQGEAK